MAGAGKQGVGEALLGVRSSNNAGNRSNSLTPNEPSDLTRRRRPPGVRGARTGPLVERENRLLMQINEGVIQQ